MNMTPPERSALIALLEDPCENVFAHVSKEIERMGVDALPLLRAALLESGHGEVFEERAGQIVSGLETSNVQSKMGDWVRGEDHRLVDALAWLSVFARPDLPEDRLREDLEELRRDIWLELNDDLTALEVVRVFNRIFFEHHGFSGHRGGAVQASFAVPSQVVATRKGNSLALGSLYLAMAQELNLPIHGVNLPNHFILAYCDDEQVLFYINPFNAGGVIHPDEVDDFLSHLDLPVDQQTCGPCSVVDVVRRVISFLGYAFDQQGVQAKGERFRDLLEHVETCSVVDPVN
jgi:regulator of sirC expression with transglutaminase-like and TPR domain